MIQYKSLFSIKIVIIDLYQSEIWWFEDEVVQITDLIFVQSEESFTNKHSTKSFDKYVTWPYLTSADPMWPDPKPKSR